MPTAELAYEKDATYKVAEHIRYGGAAFLLPESDKIIPQTGDSNPTPTCVGHAAYELEPGDLVTAIRKEFINGIQLVTLHRMVRVTERDTNSPASWFNDHVGETFRVLKFHADLIPKRYEVDLSDYMERGQVTVDRGYIPLGCAEVVE